MSLLVQVIIENIVHISLYLNIHLITRSLFENKLIFYLLDNTCLVWGKTCSGTGNCWLYNGEALRYLLNFTAASEYLTKRLNSKKTLHVVHNPFIILGFVTIGTLFDVGVWYFVKDVKIFDEEIELEDIAEEPGETL